MRLFVKIQPEGQPSGRKKRKKEMKNNIFLNTHFRGAPRELASRMAEIQHKDTTDLQLILAAYPTLKPHEITWTRMLDPISNQLTLHIWPCVVD
jgi:hypothetical protein